MPDVQFGDCKDRENFFTAAEQAFGMDVALVTCRGIFWLEQLPAHLIRYGNYVAVETTGENYILGEIYERYVWQEAMVVTLTGG